MRLELYIPGLLAAPPRLARGLALPQAPALTEWCARARVEAAAPGRYGYIAERLAVERPPLAALARLGLAGERREGLLLATPVHLQAGMDDLVLFAGPALEVLHDERVQLAADLANFFAGRPDVQLRGDCLFLRPERPLAVATSPLHGVQGDRVRAHLPRGDDGPLLNAWLNEMQMLLHDHAVNRARRERGLPVLNGLWVWGEGDLPDTPHRDDFVVFAESPFLRGLGVLTGEARERATLAEMLPAASTHVIEASACIDALDADDADAWRSAVAGIDADLLAPVLDWLAANPRAEAVLYAGDGTARRLGGGRAGMLRKLAGAIRKPSPPELVEEHSA